MIEREYTIDELLEHGEELKKASENNMDDLFYNCHPIHSLQVYTEMFKKAIRDKAPVVRWFSPHLLILRDNFRDVSQKEIEKYKDEPKVNELTTWNTFISTISEYLNTPNSLLSIIVVKDIRELIWEDCWKLLFSDYIQLGKIKIKKLNFDLALNEFILVNNAWTRANSEDEETSLCNFNDVKSFSTMFENFEYFNSIYSTSISF